MFEINDSTAADYLRSCGRAGLSEPIEVRELTGGVSNVVLRIHLPDRNETFVVKQARMRLRVKDEWICPAERIWHEVEALRYCSEITRAPCEGMLRTVVPQILWEDRANYVYAMTAAPGEHRTWKQLLLNGDVESGRPLAIACGHLLGRMHAGSWPGKDLPDILYQPTYFVQLRIDPYYYHVARVHSDLAPAIDRLIDSIWQNRRCFVHGDFSPKNLLVWPGHVMLIDFEVGHFGDPAFDLGFFLTHLVLKSIWAGERRQIYIDLATQFWRAYQTTTSVLGSDNVESIERRMLLNLAGCMLARVDGKSPVEYLNAEQREIVRGMARRWLIEPPEEWEEVCGVW